MADSRSMCACGCGQRLRPPDTVESFAAARQRAQYAAGGRYVALASGWESDTAFFVALGEPFLTAAAPAPWQRVVRVDRQTGATRRGPHKHFELELAVAQPVSFARLR